jgi:hypothetical protein
LERLPILLVGRIFNSDGLVTFADFVGFLHLALSLLQNIFKSRRGSWVGDILGDVILQNLGEHDYSTPISTQEQRSQLHTWFGGRAAENSGTEEGV